MCSNDVPNYDVVVVGAGLIGMATAQELITRHPSLTYCVVEKENRVGLSVYQFCGCYRFHIISATVIDFCLKLVSSVITQRRSAVKSVGCF